MVLTLKDIPTEVLMFALAQLRKYGADGFNFYAHEWDGNSQFDFGIGKVTFTKEQLETEWLDRWPNSEQRPAIN